MLVQIGKIIEKHPMLVIGIVILITIGFGSLLPTLKMETTMENFLPEDEVVTAYNKINDYFGASYEMLMIHVEKQESKSAVSPEAIKEQFLIGKQLDRFDETNGVMSFAEFVNNVCWMEYGKSLNNCTNDQIQNAYNDLMYEQLNSTDNVLSLDDQNEAIDYNRYPRLTKGKNIDFIDIKNFKIGKKDDKIVFTIEVYDLSGFEDNILTPHKKINVMEWYINFKNLIIPDKNLDIKYTISAHIEPKKQVWKIGQGFLENIKELIQSIKNKDLFNSYNKKVVLWIQPPDMNLSFPIELKTGILDIDEDKNTIDIIVDKDELGKFGIAPEMDGFGLPARLGEMYAGFRYYQLPNLKSPWRRITFNLEFLQNSLQKIQNRPLISEISSRIISKYGDFSFENFGDISSNMESSGFVIDNISLKDIDMLWTSADIAPDNNFADMTFFIKPFFLEEMKSNVLTFLSQDFDSEYGASATLMMVQIDGSLTTDEISEISNDIVKKMEFEDSKENYVSMRATGNGLINYEINEVTMEANGIVMPLIFVVIMIILFISFRKLSYVFIPMAGLSISVIWLFGTMVLLGMPFMVMEVALIPMLMGLGVDYSVHIFHNYRVELRGGKSPGRAIILSIRDIGTAMFLATITTFIAFMSFLSVSMIPLRDFGVLCAIGIAYTFFITITFQAALRYVIDKRKKSLGKLLPKKDPNGRTMRRIASLICRHPLPLIVITLTITGFMAFGASQISTGFDMNDFLPEENPSVIVMMDITDDFPFSSQEQEFILIEGDIATIEVLEGVKQTLENFGDDEYILLTMDGDPKTKSIIGIINNAVNQNNTIQERFNIDNSGIPKTDQDVKELFDFLYESEVYSYEILELLHKDGNNYDATLITVFTNTFGNDNSDMQNTMETLYNDLNRDIVDYGGVESFVTGENSMMYVIMNSMTDSQILSTGISIVLAGIVLVIAYRKPLLGLITMIPVLVSTIWIIGSMYFMGYSLNIMTIMITSLTIGLGITYAIHAVERFRLTADRTGDVIEAVSETIGHTGGALLIAAITTIAGFGMLILVPMPVEQQFGLITALTILYAFLTSIFILPPVLMFWGRWKKKSKGYIISPGKPKNYE